MNSAATDNAIQASLLEGPRGALRALTCGSIGDGKSTLLGRLLYDIEAVPENAIEAARKFSNTSSLKKDEFDFALLLDGLQAEHVEGMTIDVAYRHFTAMGRKCIIADAPGHEQFTRNMVSAASRSNLAILVVDACHGVRVQSIRHACIAHLMGIREMILAVNKMDLVDYDEHRYQSIVSTFMGHADKLGIERATAIPVSALCGENVTQPSTVMTWYRGSPLLKHLQTVDIATDRPDRGLVLPIQMVSGADDTARGFAGSISGSHVSVGDPVVVLPGAKTSRVSRIVTPNGLRERAEPGDAVIVSLADQLDAARGDVICAAKDRCQVADQFSAHVIWMQDKPLLPGRTYVLQLGTQSALAHVSRIRHTINFNTLEEVSSRKLERNDIAVCNLSTRRPMVIEPYARHRELGGFILIDRATNETAGAGIIEHALYRGQNIHLHSLDVSKQQRAEIKGHKACCLWFTGLSGSGKSTVANALERRLHADGLHTTILDGDNVRFGLNRDLGFTDADRVENIRRVTEVAKLMVDAGLITIVSFISPFRAERRSARERFNEREFIEVYVDTPLEVCETRDAKGLYAKARAGEIPNFTGISSPYEPPEAADIHLAGGKHTPEELADIIVRVLVGRRIVQLD